MGSQYQRQGGAVGAFDNLVRLLSISAVQLDEETATQRQNRDSRAADLRDALRVGPGSAAELAARSGIDAKRIGGILWHDVAAGRVLAKPDPRAPNRTLVYALAPRTGARP